MNALALIVLAALAADPAEPTEGSDSSTGSLQTTSSGEEPKRILLAPKIGFFKSTAPLSGAFFIGVEGGYLTPLLENRLALTLQVDFHSPGKHGVVTDARNRLLGADGSYILSQRELAFIVFATFRGEGMLPVANLTPYLGAGPGLFVHWSQVEAFGSSNTESGLTAGFGLMAGADYRLGPGAVFGELHYHFKPIGFRVTGPVNVGGFLALGVGYRLRF